MAEPVLRIFSYLPNPRVWKALIAAEFAGVQVDLVGDAPSELADWLWDFDARPLAEGERSVTSPHARTGKRGFTQTLFKTDAFLDAHPFGTVPAAFSPDGAVGIFESNSIMRAVARAGQTDHGLYGRDGYAAARIDGFLDATLVLAREAQVFLLALAQGELREELGRRTTDALAFYLDGVERALERAPFLAGETISLADIAFTCDLAQLLRGGRARAFFREAGLLSRADAGEHPHPRAIAHLVRLTPTPEFAAHIGSDLDDACAELAR